MESSDTDSGSPAGAHRQTLKSSDKVLPQWREALRELSPAYFGLVMATGIVSLASDMMGHAHLARGLFDLNIAQYGLLWLAYLLRAWYFPRRFVGDMTDHARAPGYFTLVAATGILASQFILLRNDMATGFVMWALAVTLWVLLTYTIFTAFTIKSGKPPLERGVNGTWLLAVVSTQALAVSGALLAARTGQPFRLELNLAALSMWLLGGMLYIWTMSLIFYRYTFFSLSPADLTPPYWINMGAMAISTLAGSLLIQNASQAPYLASLMPFLKGFTVLYWATGTWWIPMLLCLGIWRYGFQRFPFRYEPAYWGAIFPLGMYAACTWQLNRAMGFDFLGFLPLVFLYAALLGWMLTFVAMVRRVLCLASSPRHQPDHQRID
ncbi:putative membrane protein/MT1776 [Pigmentiphaga humi]|uniref:Putative membrane protein/MT1776 n=1 Tax=Pigmentiphaga humi TaxID=2478468 RepID=A0A3P4B6Z5_9BURK|nr:tellurite resistance/C4-dicarboxylate transporter family protein [Pigmentiphaga humi]VCU72057.1 putative membrane protein/MT1776 [Pigmentiphaga humi]